MQTTLDAPARPAAEVVSKGVAPKFTLGNVLIYLLLFALSIFFLFPLVWMILSSFKAGADIGGRPLDFNPSIFTLESYAGMLRNVPLWIGFVNTAIVILIKGGINMFFCPLAGFAFAKLRFRWREGLFNILLATLMLPVIVMLIPLLLEMGALGWVDSYQALIFPGAISAFYIFFMRQQMADIPDELLDAGRVDGCSPFQLYWKIAMPIMRPALAALAILTFLDIYNDFVWPVLAIRSPELQTLQIMLSALYTQINQASVGTAGANAWGQVLAAATLATVPLLILFIALQRHFIRGIMSGAIKG